MKPQMLLFAENRNNLNNNNPKKKKKNENGRIVDKKYTFFMCSTIHIQAYEECV